jgi:cell fate regulator YaaT (PSP1 superfamily)
MPTIIPVKFRYSARDLWFDPKGSGAVGGDHVICSTERGTEIGLATADPFEVSQAELGDAVGHSRLASVLRVATDSDLALAETLAEKGERAMPVFRDLVKQSGLEMKPVGVEYLFGGEKAVCYFAAEDRVDFRQLVRDLSHALRQRIDMRQIGVREEAAIVGGYGHCGQELCCRRFGLQFEPVSIRMAKEQDLPLNSNKISGACGRLMCCLRYEFEAYRDFKGRAPKRNAVIDTPLGKAKIVEYDTPKEEICLRIENGKQVRIPLAEMVPSEAAKRKSEELGCACRPDTVLRSSLDKLNSPDVQMALAELDRKHGVTPPEDAFDESDIFVEPKRSRRGGRKRSGGGDEGRQEGEQRRARRRRGEQGGEEDAQRQASDASQTRTRRHHRKAAGAAGEEAPQQGGRQGKAQQGQAGQGERPEEDAQAEGGRPRGGGMRRRHHRPGDAPQAQGQPQGAAGEQGARTRRRQGQGQGQPQGQGQGRQGAEGGQQPRHLRRPGDRGGQAGQGQGGRQQPRGQQGAQRAEQGPAGDPERPARRRRHSGGRGRGRGGAQGGEGGSGSPSGNGPASGGAPKGGSDGGAPKE